MTAVRPERIDAHQHFWRVSRGDYRWLTPALGSLHRDHEPSDLAPILARHRIDRTVLVQSADTQAETAFMLDLARHCPFVGAVVGWIDLERPEIDDAVSVLTVEPLVRGVRPMIQDIPDLDWMLRPSVSRGLTALEGANLVLDALVRPEHLSRLVRLVERHADLTVVLDHGGKPHIASGRRGGWAGVSAWSDSLGALAAHPRVFCKLSGLAGEAGPDWRTDDLRPYAETILDRFGPDRVLWGSDWPLVERAGGYDAWMRTTEELLATLDDDQRAAVLGGTAANVYSMSSPNEKRGAPSGAEPPA